MYLDKNLFFKYMKITSIILFKIKNPPSLIRSPPHILSTHFMWLIARNRSISLCKVSRYRICTSKAYTTCPKAMLVVGYEVVALKLKVCNLNVIKRTITCILSK